MVALADPLEPHGFLAYEALVLLQQSMVQTERLSKFRQLFITHFHGFGDMDPDDAVDIADG